MWEIKLKIYMNRINKMKTFSINELIGQNPKKF